MSQIYGMPMIGTDKVKACRTRFNDTFDALVTKFSGVVFPPTPIVGQWCLRTDQLKLYIWDSAAWRVVLGNYAVDGGGCLLLTGGTMAGNIAMGGFKVTGAANATAAAEYITKVQMDSQPRTVVAHVAGWAAAANRPLWRAPAPITIVSVHVISDTAHTGAAGNSWGINCRNVGTAGAGTTQLKATPINTQTTPLVVYDALSLALDQNLGMVADEVLQLQVTQIGTGGGTLASAQIEVVITYTLAL